MAKITVDVEALQSLSSSLASVAGDFDGADSSADQVASAVGHGGLEGAVRGFASSWDDRRAKMSEAMWALSTASHEVANAWIQFDQDGANALTSEGEAPSGPGGGVPQ